MIKDLCYVGSGHCVYAKLGGKIVNNPMFHQREYYLSNPGLI